MLISRFSTSSRGSNSLPKTSRKSLKRWIFPMLWPLDSVRMSNATFALSNGYLNWRTHIHGPSFSAASVDNALLLASVCRGVGLKADVVTGKTETNERERIIQRFKRSGGPHRILINLGVLTTGFDAPAASAALIARPTKSLVLYSQMVGTGDSRASSGRDRALRSRYGG